MNIRRHKNSDSTVLVTLSTIKDFNNVSVNLTLENPEYEEFKKIDFSKFDCSFVEKLHSDFGFSVSLEKLENIVSSYDTVYQKQ